MHAGPHRRSPRGWLLGATLLLTTALAACSGGGTTPAPAGPDLGTIDQGVIKVAYEPYAPYTSLEGDQLTGLDADILNAAAAKLNLQVTPVETDFPGMLASVQARRVDITIGGVAWTAERQKQGLFTDPPYYSPPAMAVRQGENFTSVADLQGRSLGTVEGYVWVDAIKQIPGANLHVYPDAASVFSDLGSGRIDGAFLDPLIIIAAQKSGANAGIGTTYLTPPTAAEVKAHPAYSYFQPYMTGFYLPPQETKLQTALNEQINAMYKDGSLATLITKYGGDPAQFLKPSPDMSAQRQAADRPASWTPPSL
jgi:polar amino acid transport system substrate-binding protein